MTAPTSRWLRPFDAAALSGIVLVTGVIGTLNGRSLLCRCGTVRLWAGEVRSPENSQQLADWYSLSHVLHGLLLYGALHLALPRRRLGLKLIVATLVEAAWEVAENSYWVIDRYRAATVSWGYSGDSVLNSVGDVLFMLIGFGIAARLRASWSVALGLALELAALIAIRDNFTLNVLMLVHPLASVRAWQGG